MRNSEFLDNKRPEDDNIGELFHENGVPYRIINGKKITQIDTETQQQKDVQLAINRSRSIKNDKEIGKIIILTTIQVVSALSLSGLIIYFLSKFFNL